MVVTVDGIVMDLSLVPIYAQSPIEVTLYDLPFTLMDDGILVAVPLSKIEYTDTVFPSSFNENVTFFVPPQLCTVPLEYAYAAHFDSVPSSSVTTTA